MTCEVDGDVVCIGGVSKVVMGGMDMETSSCDGGCALVCNGDVAMSNSE